jgi:hypothetical protein
MDMKTDSYGSTTTLVWVFDGKDPNVPRDVTVRFTPRNAAERLTGIPDSLFNTPAPGGELVATLPVPAVDREMITTLQIHSSSSTGKGPVLVPIKIQRPA